MKAVAINGKTYHLPFVDLISFDAHQLIDLGQSIEETGKILVPVVCWQEKSTPTSETVVDGAHRVLDAHRLNLPVPIDHQSFASEEEAQEACERLNSDRRHQSPQQLIAHREKRIKRVAKRRERGESTRQIAENEGISEAQVRRDIGDAGAPPGAPETSKNGTPGTPSSPSPKTTTGRDGKTYPASKPPVLCERCARVGSAVKDCPACVEARKPKKAPKPKPETLETAPAQEELKDEQDQVVPDGLVSVFEKAKDFHEIVNQLNAINRKLKELNEHPAGACMRLQNAQIDLKNLKETVRFDAPYAVCPVCRGLAKGRKANCPCKARGWLVETSYKNLPKEYRA